MASSLNMLSPEWRPSRELDEASLKRSAFVSTLSKGSHIHISGVCGTGTASVLTLLKELGFYVTGSDKAFYPPMGDVVRKEADKVFEGYAAENLKERPALVVIGNSLSKTNPEVQFVLQQEIPFASMPEVFLGLLIGDRTYCPTSIVISGTHGKTTTTSGMATLFDVAGRKPGYFVGGMPNNLPGSIRPVSTETPQADRVVVLEGDEYDSAFFSKYSKFHSYRPDIAVVTSIEFDHADIYNNLEEIELEFTRFVERVPETGAILVCDEQERVRSLVTAWQNNPRIKGKIFFYGERADSPFQLLKRTSIQEGDFQQRLDFSLQGKAFQTRTQLSGPHNALNLLAIAAVGQLRGLTATQIQAGIEAFSGVRRRQQVIANKNGILVIEDFAHHPTAVKVTLQGLREAYPDKRLVAVYEPRSNTSRRSFFQKEYPASFSPAHEVVFLEVANAGGYSGTNAEIVALNVNQLTEEIRAQGIVAQAFSTVEAIYDYLMKNLKSGDLAVLMSNGDFGGLPQKVASYYRS